MHHQVQELDLPLGPSLPSSTRLDALSSFIASLRRPILLILLS